MYPYLVDIFGIAIPSYGLLLLLGVCAAALIVWLLAGRRIPDISLVFLITVAGGVIGAVALRPLMKIPEVFIHWEQFRFMPVKDFILYLFGELVFYGGLIGGVAAMIVFCVRFKIPVLPVGDVFAPALAAAHGIGRIGCFLGGCCYGIKVDPMHAFSVTYPAHSLSAPAGVPLLATQLIEAASLFVISAVLILFYLSRRRKRRQAGYCVLFYGLSYSVLRFFLEFYRGDLERGIYGPFSTSQYISIMIFAISIILYIMMISKNSKQGEHIFLHSRNTKSRV